MNKEFPAGEKELRLDFERATRQNVIAIRDYSVETRNILRKMLEEITALKSIVGNYEAQVSELRKQLSILQERFYKAGTTSYGDNSGLGNENNKHSPG